MDENTNQNVRYCSNCGARIEEDEDFEEINGEVVCQECYETHTCTCDCCGAIIWTCDCYGDEYTNLCTACYHGSYTRCVCCNALLHNDDAYQIEGDDYCGECYRDETDKNRSIHEYGYKPEPIFYGDSERFFGVELEVDGAGGYSEDAEAILEIANADKEHLYIKHDGSLDEGMELVTHPMSLEYHKQFCWQEIMSKAISMGYRSHQTSTCGLHVHTATNGMVLDPRDFQRDYKLLLKRNGIREINVHGLRHTFATRALESGMSPKTLSKILGHSSVGFTLDTYAHVTDELKAEEMAGMNEFL